MHPDWRRCSSLKYTWYSQSSRLAIPAPRRPRCHAGFMRWVPGPVPDWSRRRGGSPQATRRPYRRAGILRRDDVYW